MACENAATPSGQDLGQIKGTVVDAGGVPVSGATVTTTPATREVLTDEKGGFLIPLVPVGDYAISAARAEQRGRVTASVATRQNTLVTIRLQAGDDAGDDGGGDDGGGDDGGGDDGGGDDRPDLPLGIKVYLPLDGQANDLVGTLPMGRIEGAQRTTNRMGMPGMAMQFGGRGELIEMPIPPDVNLLDLPMTWSFWLRPTPAPDRSLSMQAPIGILQPPAIDGFFCVFQQQPQQPQPILLGQYAADQGRNSLGAPVRIPQDGQWHHVAFVVDQQGMRCYIDGVMTGGAPWQGRPTVARVPHPLRLGFIPTPRQQPGSPNSVQPYAGAIDDVMIFGRALSAQEIRVLANL